jgi:dipeptidyl aminopeptidase/acylaminoacyl peptidase
MTVVRPFGAWASPISAEALVKGAVGLHEVQGCGDDVWWDEGRPEEGGRVQLVRLDGETGEVSDVLPDGYAARTRVHEYGGGAWRVHDGVLYFSNWSDQRLHRLDPGGEPRPLTPAGCRYADMDVSPDGTWLVAVREDHRGEGEALNEIVRIDTDTGEEQVLVTGPDFVASPRVDGGWLHPTRRLAWMQWNHPDMPWDAAEVWVGDLDDDGLGDAQRIAGGPGEWASEPTWDENGTLWLTSDRDGFARLHRWEGGDEVTPVTNGPEADVALPPWVFRSSRFVPAAAIGWTADTWAFVASAHDGIDQLWIVDPDGDRTGVIDVPYSAISSLAVIDGGIVAVAAGPAAEAAVVNLFPGGGIEVVDGVVQNEDDIDPDDLADFLNTPTLSKEEADRLIADGATLVQAAVSGATKAPRPSDIDGHVIRPPRDLGLDAEQISLPESIRFPSAGGRTAYGLYYPPTNPGHEAPEGEKPPLLVDIHGGPTSAARSQFQLGVQFWTSRGFAVVDVNYGGSTGYGRAFRELLNGQWGVVDVEDCVAAARFLADRGDVDPDRMAIRGGSAGGFTTLAALAFHDTFAAGVSKYGVADLAVLAQETHKFESRYLDSLIGPWPEAEAVYRERSPLFHADQIQVPLLVLQGLEDEVVPPNQSELIVEALKANGVPVGYLAFEGEQHGFRKAETIIRANEAELSFYAQVFGFTPADAIEPVEVVGL